MKLRFKNLLFLILVIGLIRSDPEDGGETPEASGEQAVKKEVTLNTIDVKLTDIQKRLYEVESKVDHVLFHNSHDVTKHSMTISPWGPMMIPQIDDPESAHTQMKTHDLLRSAMGGISYSGYNPYNAYGFGNGYQNFNNGRSANQGFVYPQLFKI